MALAPARVVAEPSACVAQPTKSRPTLLGGPFGNDTRLSCPVEASSHRLLHLDNGFKGRLRIPENDKLLDRIHHPQPHDDLPAQPHDGERRVGQSIADDVELRSTSVRLPPPPSSPNTSTVIAIVGVGYVGMSLLAQFIRRFPHIIGYDNSRARIATLKESMVSATGALYESLTLTDDASQLWNASYFLIAVPTLLRQPPAPSTIHKDSRSGNKSNAAVINLAHVRAAIQTVLDYCEPGSVVVLESSVSVGTTRALLGPYNHRIHGGMSPERVDPGRTSPKPQMIPKLVSGLTQVATDAIAALYSQCYDTVVPVSSPEVAEFTKLYENCFRMVNIAYANEIADMCRGLGVDFCEVLDAANTKPFGFMPFEAGLGVGGHCIPVNPHYLFESSRRGTLPVLERATRSMRQRPWRLAKNFHRRVVLEMAQRQRFSTSNVCTRTKPRVLVVGLGFKTGESNLSNSPGIAFAEAVRNGRWDTVSFYDPLVEQGALKDDQGWLQKLEHTLWDTACIEFLFDGVAVCMRQVNVDWSVLQRVNQRRCFVRWF